MYQTLRENMSITDLIQKASSLSADDNAVKRLMNLIMQFRKVNKNESHLILPMLISILSKVCNHPELFERADVEAPLSFCDFNASINLLREGDKLDLPYAVSSPINIDLPKLLLRNGDELSDTLHLAKLFNIWQPAHTAQSLRDEPAKSAFAFTAISKHSPSELRASTGKQLLPSLSAILAPPCRSLRQ